MNTEKIKELADNAEVIICGYAFSKCENGISVLNLNAPDHAAVFSNEGEILETSMDDIELSIVRDYLEKSKKYMECENA
ncbi:hypothetical protein [uncultured Treponema sp.]|uniref:DUF7723 family protein n=1 Tax=uncultured Treponema sp. TaxID=162155 RepID=UPI002583A0F6|nr:hypothetical protein [uncultured Treponema sp.]